MIEISRKRKELQVKNVFLCFSYLCLPFCTGGGSRLSDTTASIKTAEPDTTLLDGLAIRDSSISDAKQDVIKWLKGAGVLT